MSVVLIIFLISAILALRSLQELEVPKEAFGNIRRRVKRWNTVLFLRGRQIFYRVNQTKKIKEEKNY